MNTEQALVTFTQELVGIPSLSGHEKQVAQTIQRKMAELHYDEVIIDGFGSVIGKIHGKNQGKTVLLDGHIDHVDVIDRADWKYDPFGAVIDNGKIYGRAASDMKGSVAAMILSAADFRADTKGDFDGTICVACTVHEECFEGVSAREISRSVHPDFVIIGEATSGTLKIGQRGRAEVVVETEGKSCHSSNPEKGVNAVYHMVSVIEALREIKH